jgi:dissimilatory sulfite reductase (desulfoviridin) alpha/beta subunit
MAKIYFGLIVLLWQSIEESSKVQISARQTRIFPPYPIRCVIQYARRNKVMQWTAEAEAAIKKVPFFVRKRVRARVEDEAQQAGKKKVSLADVRLTQKRYLAKMSDEVRGYQLETCFGPGGCPNRAIDSDTLVERLEEILQRSDLRNFLEARVKGGLKHHHEFRATVADCPNACSQPQIKDMGIIGAAEPVITNEPCTLCQLCVEACAENAVRLKDSEEMPEIDYDRCVRCGKCIDVCPTGTLATGQRGYRVLLAGKLGRHPRLAEELPGIYQEDEVLSILEGCLDYYKRNSKHGERFAEVYQDAQSLGLAILHASPEEKRAK